MNNYDSRTMQELEYLYEDTSFFDIRIDRRGNVIDVDYDIDNLDEDYVGEFSELAQAIPDFVESLKRVKFYNGLIELSNNQTMYSIDREIGMDEYQFALDQAINGFEEETGVEVFLEGRSGRHICVSDTVENIIDYNSLKDKQKYWEKWLVEFLNEVEE